MLGISISLNAMSAHGTCTAVFVVVAAVIAFSLGSIQTLHQVSWLAWVGASSIVIASEFTYVPSMTHRLTPIRSIHLDDSCRSSG